MEKEVYKHSEQDMLSEIEDSNELIRTATIAKAERGFLVRIPKEISEQLSIKKGEMLQFAIDKNSSNPKDLKIKYLKTK